MSCSVSAAFVTGFFLPRVFDQIQRNTASRVILGSVFARQRLPCAQHGEQVAHALRHPLTTHEWCATRLAAYANQLSSNNFTVQPLHGANVWRARCLLWRFLQAALTPCRGAFSCPRGQQYRDLHPHPCPFCGRAGPLLCDEHLRCKRKQFWALDFIWPRDSMPSSTSCFRSNTTSSWATSFSMNQA